MRQGTDVATPSRGQSMLRGSAGFSTAVIACAGFFLLIVTGVVYGWKNWGEPIVARPIYRMQAESFQVTPPPPWIRTDVRAEIVRDGALEDLTIFDKDATIRVFQAFELHPWVAKVQRVSKHPPAKLVVDLEYREPIAWVEVAAAKPGEMGGVIPIDSFGYVLPSRDFSKDHLPDYLRISIPNVRPFGLAGSAWGDSRVVGAARIAAVLKAHWKSLGLYRIRWEDDPEGTPVLRDPTYLLETVNHQLIVWGHGPGTESPEEPSAALKLRRLVQLAESVGSLDRLPAAGLDLRDPNRSPTAAIPLRDDATVR